MSTGGGSWGYRCNIFWFGGVNELNKRLLQKSFGKEVDGRDSRKRITKTRHNQTVE